MPTTIVTFQWLLLPMFLLAYFLGRRLRRNIHEIETKRLKEKLDGVNQSQYPASIRFLKKIQALKTEKIVSKDVFADLKKAREAKTVSYAEEVSEDEIYRQMSEMDEWLKVARLSAPTVAVLIYMLMPLILGFIIIFKSQDLLLVLLYAGLYVLAIHQVIKYIQVSMALMIRVAWERLMPYRENGE